MDQVLFLISLHPPMFVNVIVVCVGVERKFALVQLVIILTFDVVGRTRVRISLRTFLFSETLARASPKNTSPWFPRY